LYAVVAVVLVVLAAGIAWATGMFGLLGRTPDTSARVAESAASASRTASETPGTGAASTDTLTVPASGSTPTVTPVSSDLLADSAAAVKAAALAFPNPAALTPKSISHAKPTRKLVAITLDDGIPFNMKTLELFEQRKVVCTTFLLGQFVSKNPDLVERLHRDGFEIANHTWDHKTLTKLSDAQVRSELSRTQQSISKVTGNQAPYMRPPGGASSLHLRTLVASMGYHVVLWDKTFADTSSAATSEKLFHNVMDGLKPGDIILCHWGGKSTYEALQLILPEMERRGFTPVTLSEMLKDQAATASQ
jgi:peptidoglycan-N-acetylglucosamine deacetylase